MGRPLHKPKPRRVRAPRAIVTVRWCPAEGHWPDPLITTHARPGTYELKNFWRIVGTIWKTADGPGEETSTTVSVACTPKQALDAIDGPLRESMNQDAGGDGALVYAWQFVIMETFK